MVSNFGFRNTKASKLTLVQVAEIRRLYNLGRTQAALCREFGVSVGQIGRIVRGESWQGVAVEPTEEEMAASHARIMEALARAQEPKRQVENEMKVLKEEMKVSESVMKKYKAFRGEKE